MTVTDFCRHDLIAHFGSWVRVQVAFYDFLFESSMNKPAAAWNADARAAMETGGFADGAPVYERAVRAIEGAYPTPEGAWIAFMASLPAAHGGVAR